MTSNGSPKTLNDSETMENTESDLLGNGSVMLDAQEIDDADLNAIKGDTIGSTVYSAKWTLDNLISLTKVSENGWTDKLENDLCILWDMTAEKDVVEFLVDNNFLEIAEFILKVTQEHRLVEILIGILGNMCCQTLILDNIAHKRELTNVILNFLLSEDTETLIQVLRFLQVILWDIQKNSNSIWSSRLRECNFFGDALVFILKSSTNDQLLRATVDLVFSLSDIKLPDDTTLMQRLFKIDESIFALVECFTQLFPHEDIDYTDSANFKVIENWLGIISNLTKQEIIDFMGTREEEKLKKITDVLLRILHPYETVSNLIPVEERIALCIYECIEILSYFHSHGICTIPEIDGIIVTITYNLKQESSKEESHTDSNGQELLKCLENYWMEILHFYSTEQIKEIFCLCDKSEVKSLVECLCSHPKSLAENVEKLINAVP